MSTHGSGHLPPGARGVTGWARTGAGVAAGLLTAPAECALTLAALPFLLAPPRAAPPPAPLGRAGARLAAVSRRRMAWAYGTALAPPTPGVRALRYVGLRWSVGGLGGLVLLAGLTGAGYATFPAWGWLVLDGLSNPGSIALSAFGGLFLVFLCVPGLRAVALLDEQLARRHLGPGEGDLLRHRIGELAASRAGVVRAVDEERRRIERDLHDGVQQRLVALGLLLGRARRQGDAERAATLLAQAHEESAGALRDLREVAWRVYPAVLDERGLEAALEAVADAVDVPVHLTVRVPARLPDAVRTAAYFVTAEAVTNAVKHAGARRIEVEVTACGPSLRGSGLRGASLCVGVRDDGCGGADPDGPGLRGLARRVAALDGHLTVADAAPGAATPGTELRADLPCA